MLRRLCTAPALVVAGRSRCFSTTCTPLLSRSEQVTIPCRSEGAITLDILHGASPASPVLLYLPPGPVVPEHRDQDDGFVAALAASSKSTVARINYRFSPAHCWPTPLYDVLAGYDWVLENLLDHQPRPARLGVCGELVGGSLATTLALTECRLGEHRIVSAAVNNPIADWVFPDELPVIESAPLPEPRAPDETQVPADQDMMAWWAQQDEKEQLKELVKAKRKRQRRARKTSWLVNGDNSRIPSLTLSGKRDLLFPNPHQLLDRFASPIHFFRSPHGQLLYPQDDDYPSSSSTSETAPEPIDLEAQMSINHYEALEPSDLSSQTPVWSRCRAYARIYPDSTTSISLPRWHITCGLQSPLLDQASELTKMLKRSIARHALRTRTARVMWQDPAEMAKYEAWADERVRYNTVEGVGLWSLPEDGAWKTQADDVGQWMSHTLKLER